MTSPLARYLHDHLAGATYALDLVEGLAKRYRGEELGKFAKQLHEEILADKEALNRLALQFGPTSDPLKDGAAWIAEKVSRIKLSYSDKTGLGLFEALEFLTLGIHGKAGLWRALAEVADRRHDFGEIGFTDLIKRAQEQERTVEQFRLAAACRVFAATAPIIEFQKHS